MIRKSLLLIAALTLTLAAWGVKPAAAAEASVPAGLHVKHFNLAQGGHSGAVDVYYRIGGMTDPFTRNNTVSVYEICWNAPVATDAISVQFESNPGPDAYQKVHMLDFSQLGGSASTHDDVDGGSWCKGPGSSDGQDHSTFTDTDSPALRVLWWGLGSSGSSYVSAYKAM